METIVYEDLMRQDTGGYSMKFLQHQWLQGTELKQHCGIDHEMRMRYIYKLNIPDMGSEKPQSREIVMGEGR